MAFDPFTRESTIRRDREGRWFHDETEVTNLAIARALDRWIARSEDGRYILKNAINWVYVRVEGAPLSVQRIELKADIELHLSNGAVEVLDPATLRQDEAGALFCDAQGMPASFTRNAQR